MLLALVNCCLLKGCLLQVMGKLELVWRVDTRGRATAGGLVR